MKISTAIILAGGLGTRLRSRVPDLPKCMAPVAGRPFISYLIDDCIQQGIEQFIFSLGYMHELVTEHVRNTYPNLNARFVIEKEPLGTGGAIQMACSIVPKETVFIINGDTFFKINLKQAEQFHNEKKADCTLVLKPMKNISRYGVVETAADGKIKSFREKQFYSEAAVNGGAYILNVPAFLSLRLPEKFSFEKDFLEQHIQQMRLYGLVQDVYFIDIGIPEDFERANVELMNLQKTNP